MINIFLFSVPLFLPPLMVHFFLPFFTCLCLCRFCFPFFFFAFFSLTHPASCCSCRGRGQLWRGLPQSKDSDRGAIRALHLDPYSGEAVMLHPPDHPFLTNTVPHHPSTLTAKPASPACLSSSKVSAWAIAENDTERQMHTKTNTETNTGSDTARQRTIPKKETLRQMWTQWCVIRLKETGRKDLITIPL